MRNERMKEVHDVRFRLQFNYNDSLETFDVGLSLVKLNLYVVRNNVPFHCIQTYQCCKIVFLQIH